MPERCGARFRKPVSEISDRAKRYRAHSPGCRPKGPKVCFKCGSRRFVVPDHIDGDESNGRPSNLRWACKSHNTILGKKMAKAGKGVRTRQYNPKHLKVHKGCRNTSGMPCTKRDTRKNPGAGNLAQYVQAAVDHTRGSHDAGGKVIHETPKSKRREYAREIWFRRGHNPPSDIMKEFRAGKLKDSHGKLVRSKEQAKAILLSELRARGEVGPRKNPDDGTEADKLYRKFHGRGPDKIINLQIRGIDPYGDHPALTSLGPLIRLVVGEEVEIIEKDKTWEIGDADWVNEITWPRNVSDAEFDRIASRLDKDSPQDIREFKAWLKAKGSPDVAGVPPKGRQLYFIGGDQTLDEALLRKLGCDPEKDICDLGDLALIEYFAQKRFDRFDPTIYFHILGEETDVRPRVFYMRHARQIFLAGGEYRVLPTGIDN